MPKRDEFKTKVEWLEHLRLWFAGMALQGFITNPEYDVWGTGKVSRLSYAHADAMIKEMEKP